MAVSRSLSKVSYFLDAGDEIASTVRDGALASCRNDGATDCKLLHEWINACVAVGSVPVDGVKQILSARRAPSELQNDKPDQSVPGVILKVSVACRMRIAQNRGVVTSRIECPSLNSRWGFVLFPYVRPAANSGVVLFSGGVIYMSSLSIGVGCSGDWGCGGQ